MTKNNVFIILLVLIIWTGCRQNAVKDGYAIKAYCIDYNWDLGGAHGFAAPIVGNILHPVDYYLSQPLGSYEGDEFHIAVLARVYNKLPFDYVK